MAPSRKTIHFRYSTNDRREAIELRFQQSMVQDIIINPPQHPGSRNVPITAAHLQNVRRSAERYCSAFASTAEPALAERLQQAPADLRRQDPLRSCAVPERNAARFKRLASCAERPMFAVCVMYRSQDTSPADR